MVTWILMCFAMLALGIIYSSHISLSWHDVVLLVPALGLIVYLAWNWKLSKKNIGKKNKGSSKNTPYENEVELIKFVERHANYMIFGVTGVFIAAQYFIGQNNSSSSPNFNVFYIFTVMSLLFSVWGVLPLIWSPKEDEKHLEWLRHYKTVWYGYAIFLLCAGILAFAKAILVQAGIIYI